jgi:hypothetical protein
MQTRPIDPLSPWTPLVRKHLVEQIGSVTARQRYRSCTALGDCRFDQRRDSLGGGF